MSHVTVTITTPSVGISPAAQTVTIEPIAKSCWGTPLSTSCKGHQARRFEMAKSELFPKGMPSGLEVSMRNRMFEAYFKSNGWGPISDRHLQRLNGGR